MAKIVASDDAPKGKFRFSLANVEIEKLPYTTDDVTVIANAEVHPWLKVEQDVSEELADVDFNPFPQTLPEDDVLSAQNSKANDPKAVKAELDRRKALLGGDVAAIDAGLDQNEVVETDSGVDLTVAADKADDKESKK